MEKYDVYYDEAVDDIEYEQSDNGSWYRAEDVDSSLQKLKAEIAAIADSVEDYTTAGADTGTVACIVLALRQLSAV